METRSIDPTSEQGVAQCVVMAAIARGVVNAYTESGRTFDGEYNELQATGKYPEEGVEEDYGAAEYALNEIAKLPAETLRKAFPQLA